jgi:hypothetical protein
MVLKGLTLKESLLKCAEMWEKVASYYPAIEASEHELKEKAILEMGYIPDVDTWTADSPDNCIECNCFMCNLYNVPGNDPNFDPEGCDKCNTLMLWNPTLKEFLGLGCPCYNEGSPYFDWLQSMRSLTEPNAQEYALEIARRARNAVLTLEE